MRGLSQEASSIQHSTCLLCTLQYCFLLPSCDSSLGIKRITTWPIYWQSIKNATWSIFIFSILFYIHLLLRWQGEFVYQTDVRRNNAGHHKGVKGYVINKISYQNYYSHYLKCDYRSFNDIMRVNKYNNNSYHWL